MELMQLASEVMGGRVVVAVVVVGEGRQKGSLSRAGRVSLIGLKT